MKNKNSEKQKSFLVFAKNTTIHAAQSSGKKAVAAIKTGAKKLSGAIRNRKNAHKLKKVGIDLETTVQKTEVSQTLVPAVCTQCGAALQVDPAQKEAVCGYCGTAFIVTDAISQFKFNIQQAKIHADRVVIEKKSRYEATLDYLQERKKLRIEERKRKQKQMEKEAGWLLLFILLFFLIFAVFYGPSAGSWRIQAASIPAPEGQPEYRYTTDDNGGKTDEYDIHQEERISAR